MDRFSHHWGDFEGKNEYHGFKFNDRPIKWEKEHWVEVFDLYSSQKCLNCQLMNLRRWVWSIKKRV